MKATTFLFAISLILFLSCTSKKAGSSQTKEPGGTFTDERDGMEYSWFRVDNVKWMAQNLAYLPELCSPADSCGYWVFERYDSTLEPTDNQLTRLGVLYSYETAKKSCPSGWSLPHTSYWIKLEASLGVNAAEAKRGFGYRGAGSSLAYKLKNPEGFNAAMGGIRKNDGTFEGGAGYYWTSEAYGRLPRVDALARMIPGSGPAVLSDAYPMKTGMSVRCIQVEYD